MKIQNTDFYIVATAENSSEHSEAGQSDQSANHSASNQDNQHSEEAAHSTQQADGHAKQDDGIAALGLDPFAIGAQLLTFVVLFWFVKKFALTKIVSNLQKRREDINRGLHLTAELDKQKAELDQRMEDVLRKARKQADAIISEAHTQTGQIIQEAEQAANRKAEEIIRSAEGKIERDIVEARNGLKKEMAGLIVEATEAILEEKLDSDADKKLVEKYLERSL